MINITINQSSCGDKFNTSLLKPKKTLFEPLWVDQDLKSQGGNSLKSDVNDQLLKIAQDIIESMDIDVEIKDIIVTGSIASYNWHELSDIDLHILLDFEDIDPNKALVKKMLDQSRINWNKTHNIFIHGKEVELYFQDLYEPHESNGIWSLMEKKWLAEPVKLEPEIDLRNSEKKAEMIAKSIDHVEDLYEEEKYKEAFEYSSKIKSKISRMRSAGLKEDGLYSQENLAFKMLRNANYLEKISMLKIDSYDKMMSLSTINEIKDYFNNNKHNSEYLEYEGKYNVEDLMDPNKKDAPWGDTEDEIHD